MELENILYGGVQLVHNFGAAAVTGLPIAALWFKPPPPVLRRMALLTLVAWLAQSASGAGFGTVSFFQEGELPQIHHLALAALCVKIACAALAVTLLTVHFLRRTASRSERCSGCCNVARLGDPRGHGVSFRRHFAMVFLSGCHRHTHKATSRA